MDACRGHDHHAREARAREPSAPEGCRLPAVGTRASTRPVPRTPPPASGFPPFLGPVTKRTVGPFPLTRPPLPASPASASLAHPWQANPKLDHKEAFTMAAGNWSKQKK